MPTGSDESAEPVMHCRGRSFRSCSWCHEINDVGVELCGNCGHQAHAARMFCACSQCAGRAALASQAPPTMWRSQQPIVHYAPAGMITDCGRELGVVGPGRVIRGTANRGDVTCGECLDAIAHLDAKVKRCSSSGPPHRGEDD